jgi:hypothetical protein
MYNRNGAALPVQYTVQAAFSISNLDTGVK